MRILEHPTFQKIRQHKSINYFELLFRIITGIFLIVDGFHILSHVTELEASLWQTLSVPLTEFIVIFIGTVHLLGGAFIVLGLLTRIVLLLQIPAILAEMYYIQPPNHLLGDWEIVASSILLILLVLLFVKNSGKFSMDYYRKRPNNQFADQ